MSQDLKDRPALTEIEITPEMIEAGKDVFFREMIEADYLDTASREEYIAAVVAGIYRAMVNPPLRRGTSAQEGGGIVADDAKLVSDLG